MKKIKVFHCYEKDLQNQIDEWYSTGEVYNIIDTNLKITPSSYCVVLITYISNFDK